VTKKENVKNVVDATSKTTVFAVMRVNATPVTEPVIAIVPVPVRVAVLNAIVAVKMK